MFIKGFPVDIATVSLLFPVSCHVHCHFDGEVVAELSVEVEKLDLALVFWREVAVENDVDVGATACGEVSVAGVRGDGPAFESQLLEELLRLRVLDVQVNVDIPDLGVVVGLFGSEELLCEFLPLGSGVDCLGVNCTDNEPPALHAHLGADGFVVVESLPALLREDAGFFQHDGALAIVLVLRLGTAFLDFVLGIDDQGVGGEDGLFGRVDASLYVDLEVAVFFGQEQVVGFQFVEVLALSVEPVDVLEEDA